MNKMRLGFKVCVLVAITMFAASCSDDNSDYKSVCPRFSDITLETKAGSTTLCVGDTIIATAVQSSLGRLLNGTTYTWSSSGSTDTDSVSYVSHKYTSSVLYDNDKSNPTDTIIVSKAGSYTLNLACVYKISGIYSSTGSSTSSSGFSATYAGGSTRYQVTLSKSFTVVNK